MFFNRDNFIVIQGFAVTELKLSGNELICYSLIYGFTQDKETAFQGGLTYIAGALNISKNSARSVLERLIGKGLIVKIEKTINGVKLCDYIANDTPVQETCTPPKQVTPRTRNLYTPVQETCTPPIQETCTNNNIINNINNNINYNIAEQNDLFGNAPKSKDKKTLFRNSEIYALADFKKNDYSKVEELFKGNEYENIDIVYYFHSVADWSDSSNTKRTARGWIATIRNFIRGDIERGKLHTITQQTQGGFDFAAAQEFLNM